MIVFDYTLQVVLLGSSFLGIVSGALGSFAMLRKQSLLGDAISHAALPGIAGMFLITQTKSPFWLLVGALIAGWIGTVLMLVITRYTRLKQDAALGIILSVFFGFGLVLLTIIQDLPTARQSGLHSYLFGNASTLLLEDVMTLIGFGLVALGLLRLFWKEFKVMTFDSDFALSLGFPRLALEVLLTTLIVIAIVVGLQCVGVVLMSAMIIAPAAAARQWTDKLGFMVCLSSIFGAISGVFGAIVSAAIPKLPTGPTIVLFISAIVLVSLLFSPHRGLVMHWIKQRKRHHEIRKAAP